MTSKSILQPELSLESIRRGLEEVDRMWEAADCLYKQLREQWYELDDHSRKLDQEIAADFAEESSDEEDSDTFSHGRKRLR